MIRVGSIHSRSTGPALAPSSGGCTGIASWHCSPRLRPTSGRRGVPHFFAWYYTATPPVLSTTEGLEIGDTLQALDDLYGGVDLIIDEDPFDPTGGYWSYDLVGWTGLWGYADGTDPDSIVTSVNGGRGCGE